MAFEDVMAAVGRWSAGVEALAALGAELSLLQAGRQAPPEIAAALAAVSESAGLSGLDTLPPQQQAIIAGLVRLTIRQATDLLDEPGREPGWAYTDPIILDGWGRASAMVPALMTGAAPELRGVESFLDVGTGVGLLAVAAASVWPASTIVGIDRWEPALERARANVAAAGLEARITLRRQDLTEVDDVDRYDCAWVPTFFVTEPALVDAMPRVARALRPGGWVVLGRMVAPPDPVAAATVSLRTIRHGGVELESERAVQLLEEAGFTDVRALRPLIPVPMEFVMGQRPAG